MGFFYTWTKSKIKELSKSQISYLHIWKASKTWNVDDFRIFLGFALDIWQPPVFWDLAGSQKCNFTKRLTPLCEVGKQKEYSWAELAELGVKNHLNFTSKNCKVKIHDLLCWAMILHGFATTAKQNRRSDAVANLSW